MTITAGSLAADIAPTLADRAFGNDNPMLAFNTAGGKTQFLDLMKTAPDWIGHLPGRWGGVSNDKLEEAGVIDEAGWLTGIPEEVSYVGTHLMWSSEPELAEYRKGVYVLEYEGEGTIGVSGDARIISQENGKIVFESEKGKNIYIGIKETDPDGTGDNLRNITLVREDQYDLFEAGAVYNPDYIELVADTRHLRFMNWLGTNNSDDVTWEDRNAPGDFRGATLEDMVQLANEAGVDPWFTIPHMADEEYIRNFATYVRDNLDPDLQVRVEYSNEVWNFSFDQTKWLYNQAKSEWGSTSNGRHIDYHAKMAVKTAMIWEDVFAEEAEGRLINVLGGQSGNPGVAGRLLNPELWAEMEPENYIDPTTIFEEIAITEYFGSGSVGMDEYRDDLIAAVKDPSVDAKAWLAERLLDPDYRGSIPASAERWQANADIAEASGLKLVAYEGGQHVHHSWAISGYSPEDKELLTQFLIEFVRSPEMVDLYDAAWAAWSDVTDSPFMQYADIYEPSKWGSWGLFENILDTSERADRLMELNESYGESTANVGGEHYQQGVTLQGTDEGELLIGTSQEDYLIGHGGDDTMVAGLGDDGIHGGDGHDRLVMRGAAADYTITAEGNGWRVDGPEGSDLLIEMEEIHFASGEILDLTTMTIEDTGTLIEEAAPEPETPAEPDAGAAETKDETEEDPAPENNDEDTGALTPSDSDLSEPRTLTPGPVLNGGIAMAGEFVDTTGMEDVLFQTPDNINTGLIIRAVHHRTALGHELGLEATDRAYYAYDREGLVEIEGQMVSGSYWSMENRRAEQDGDILGDSAIGVAQQIGSVIYNVEGVVTGSAKNDVITGRNADDIFNGGAGNDMIRGEEGNDILRGGAGNDKLYGGAGDDILGGSAGDDYYNGEGGIDIAIFAGNADDYSLSFDGTLHTISGTDGTDTFRGIEHLLFENGEQFDVARLTTDMEIGTTYQLEDVLPDLIIDQGDALFA